MEWNFIDDERDGVRNMYYENGQLKAEWKYIKWEEVWIWKYWNKNTKVLEEFSCDEKECVRKLELLYN